MNVILKIFVKTSDNFCFHVLVPGLKNNFFYKYIPEVTGTYSVTVQCENKNQIPVL